MTSFTRNRTAISLFTGAGGMDVGFAQAGFESVLACELDSDACETFNSNLHLVGHRGNRIVPTSVTELDLEKLPKGVDVVFGGPPCQGFSVAGKMDPNDDRSKLIHSFFDVVEAVQPSGFVCENVKALAVSSRWEDIRKELFQRAGRSYAVAMVVLNATDFGVPQNRERMFLVGIRSNLLGRRNRELQKRIELALESRKKTAPKIADLIRVLGKAGTDTNPKTCTAKISFAKSPVLRRSPYAGMLFNGAGRPMPIDGYASTLPASMGGNKTPIVDEAEIFEGATSFIEEYHSKLQAGEAPRSGDAPDHLRRLTIKECMAIQTFPPAFQFVGRKSSVYRQIGNAVPCGLAEAVASAFHSVLAEAEQKSTAEAAA